MYKSSRDAAWGGGDCDFFQRPSLIALPFFIGNDFFDLSVSVWLNRRRRDHSAWPVLVSNGDCDRNTFQVRIQAYVILEGYILAID